MDTVIVHSYGKKWQMVLAVVWVIVSLPVMGATVQTVWWLGNVFLFVLVLFVVKESVTSIRFAKQPLQAVRNHPGHRSVDIDGPAAFSGEWHVKKGPKPTWSVFSLIYLLFLLAFLWWMAGRNLYHAFFVASPDSPMSNQSAVAMAEVALMFTVLAIQSWQMRRYKHSLIAQRPGKILHLYSTGMFSNGIDL